MVHRSDAKTSLAVSSQPTYGTSSEAGSSSIETDSSSFHGSFQDDAGAPVEKTSPLGRHVNWLSVIFLNVGVMVGTGIFSTPSSILSGTGSVGLSLVYWFLGFIVSCAGLAVYLELAAYFPHRSGSEVAYLEQAFPRPKYFFPIAFAVQSVILSFSSSNSIVLAQYIFKLIGHTPSRWEQKGVAVAGYSVATLVVILNTKWSLRFANLIGGLKILALVFIAITGLAVLGGKTRVRDPGANFVNIFEGSTDNGNALATALVKVTYAYTGYANAFNLANEVQNPVPTLKKNSSIALAVVAGLYILVNISYFAAVSKEDLKASEQTAAALFFDSVFGSSSVSRALNILPVLSAFGNLIAVLIGASRMVRECGRQGVLPWPKFWASTRPFGTPLGPYFLKWATTVFMIVVPPAGDAFNFIIDLRSYPESIFIFAMTAGVFVIRRRWKQLGQKRPPEFRAWDLAVWFYLAVNAFILVMPWVPPEGGANGGDVSFWYATYCVVGIGIVLVCVVYYIFWIYVLPRWGNYRIRQEAIDYGGGALSNKLIKVPLDTLADWDEVHDEAGNIRGVGPRKAAEEEDEEAMALNEGIFGAGRIASLRRRLFSGSTRS